MYYEGFYQDDYLDLLPPVTNTYCGLRLEKSSPPWHTEDQDGRVEEITDSVQKMLNETLARDMEGWLSLCPSLKRIKVQWQERDEEGSFFEEESDEGYREISDSEEE